MSRNRLSNGTHNSTRTLIKIFDKLICRGFNRSLIFNDWLDIMLYALMRDDVKYLKLIDKYKDDRVFGTRNIDIFCELFTALIIAMDSSKADILGDFFECQISYGENGQFFTPENLCYMMAQLNYDSSKVNQKVYDCACGSGRTLLAYGKIQPKNYFIGWDLDPRCVKMTALNLFLNGLEGECLCINTLTMQDHRFSIIVRRNKKISYIENENQKAN